MLSIRISALAALILMSGLCAGPSSLSVAYAAMGGPGVCGTSCLAGGRQFGMFGPFYSTPFLPPMPYAYMTGQMPYLYPMMGMYPSYVSNISMPPSPWQMPMVNPVGFPMAGGARIVRHKPASKHPSKKLTKKTTWSGIRAVASQ